MVINKYQHAEAVNTLVSFLSDEQKNDPRVKSFLDELQLSVGEHYCVAYKRYIEDGMYDFASDPEQFATREQAEKYLEEQGASSYYDDEREVCVDCDEHTESFDDYVVDDEGWYLWKE